MVARSDGWNTVAPFFAVVTMYRQSIVNSMSVAGNSYPSSQN